MAIVFLLVIPFIKNDDILKAVIFIFIIVVIILLILANTWPKKK